MGGEGGWGGLYSVFRCTTFGKSEPMESSVAVVSIPDTVGLWSANWPGVAHKIRMPLNHE